MEIVKINKLYTYDQYLKVSYLIEKNFKEYCKIKKIGITHDKRDILLFQLGTGSRKVLLTAGIHGCESVNPISLLKWIEWYCNQLSIQAREPLYTFYVIPMCNPDGYEIANFGFDTIRNASLHDIALRQNIPFQNWKYNARSVDLNRNFPSVTWKPGRNSSVPASENETQAIIKVMNDTNTMGYIDYHSRGEAVYFYRNVLSEEYNKKQKQLAASIRNLTGYELMAPSDEIDRGDSGGNTVHYYSESKGKPALTIETVDESLIYPLSPILQEETLLKISETPFIFY